MTNHFLVPVPPQVQSDINRMGQEGERLLAIGAFGPAFEVYRQLNERMLNAQTRGTRLHKGLPLHQMGVARIRAGLYREGIRWTLFAFIEDALSRAEESDNMSMELSRPAAQMLRLYGLTESQLRQLAQRIRRRVSKGELIQDPTTVFVAERLDAVVERLTRAAEQGKASAATQIELAPVEVRIRIPFLDVRFGFTLPPVQAASAITAALFALAAAGAVGLFWVTGVLQQNWRVAVAVLFAGILLAAVAGLLVQARGTTLARWILIGVRLLAAHIVVPLVVAVIGGIVAAYVTGAWAP